jgi:hypothetical protein
MTDSHNVFKQKQGSACGAARPIGIEAKHDLIALESGGRIGTYFNRVDAAENILIPSPVFFAVTFSPGLHSLGAWIVRSLARTNSALN